MGRTAAKGIHFVRDSVSSCPMKPQIKLILLVLGAAGVWAFGMLGLFRVFLSAVSDMGNNTGALAAPLVGIVYGFIYGVVGAFLVALLLGISRGCSKRARLFRALVSTSSAGLGAHDVASRSWSDCGRLQVLPRGSFKHQHVFRALQLDSQESGRTKGPDGAAPFPMRAG